MVSDSGLLVTDSVVLVTDVSGDHREHAYTVRHASIPPRGRERGDSVHRRMLLFGMVLHHRHGTHLE